jgi:hypothetical protein
MMRRETGRTRSGMGMGRATSLHWNVRDDIGEAVQLGSVKGLASSQRGRETKVAHSASSGIEPRRRGHRRDRRGLFDNSKVNIVPAIVNRSSRDRIGIYRDTGESERKN